MSTELYKEEEADLRFKGDYLLVDGTLEVDGTSKFDGAVTISAPAVTATKSLTISSKMTTHTGVKLGAPSGTTAGDAWTSGAPTLTAAQMYIVATCGSTDYRIPIFNNA